MEPKPTHLSADYADQFRDRSVAAAYASRPPYPDELFEVVESLIPDGSRVVLDVGCGTGDLSVRLAPRVDRVDAVDPSEAMLAVGRARPGGDHPALRWHCARAEDFVVVDAYSLVVAGESFHWVDWGIVPGRIAAALRPGAYLALVVHRALVDVPWDRDLARIIPRYSTNQAFRPYDLVEELSARGLFREVGRHTTAGEPFEQSVDDYVESFHTRNGFSRERMDTARAAEFDAAVRALVQPHSRDGRVHGATSATIVWGWPSGPRSSA